MQIAYHTNQRLEILRKSKSKLINPTNTGEVMIVLGCSLVMAYNRVPSMHMYWSRNKSLGNQAIRESISRDRFMLISSKLYFNNPDKPQDASKTYYIDEVVNCLQEKFLGARTDSSYQSLDESMAKFKGRSSMKQYLPMKPVKRGIKLWTRCDATTGYVYDTSIYSGKEVEAVEGTLGERVVYKLSETIKKPNVVLCFDRFFTSVNLLNNIKFPALGTYMQNRKNTPKFLGKLEQRGESEMAGCQQGILAVRWKDTKDVLVMSNCHDNTVGIIPRKMKDGTTKEFECPEAIIFYNAHMGV